jgi:hypothetical protein
VESQKVSIVEKFSYLKRAERVGHSGARRMAWALLDDPLQRGVRDEAAVPIEFALDLNRRKAGRKRSTRYHVLGSDRMLLIIEVDEIAGAHVDRTDAEPHLAGIDPVEVDQPLQRAIQNLGFVKTRGLETPVRVQPGSGLPKREKAGRAREEGGSRTKLVEERPRHVAFRSEGVGGEGNPVEQRVGGDLLPEGAQLRDPLGRFVSRDDG